MTDFNLVHDLTMLYLEKRDITKFTPTELLDEYKNVHEKIRNRNEKNYRPKWPL